MPIVVTETVTSTGIDFAWLQNAIAKRLARNDLADLIPDFVTLGTARIYYGLRDPEAQVDPLRLRAMLVTETSELDSLPVDFLEVDRFAVPTSYGDRILHYKTPAEFARLAPNAGCPTYYTLQDGGVAVEGGLPAAFTFSFYRKFPALVEDSDTNWLLANHPNVYFYSALIEAYQHVRNDARALSAARMFASAANAAVYADQQERHSGSVLSIPVSNAV